MKKIILSTMALLAATATVNEYGPTHDTIDQIAEIITNYSAPTEQQQCLIDNVFHEARGESIKGQKLVAAVTLARVKHRSWPNTVCEVVHQDYQFSWTLLTDKVLANRIKKEHKTYTLLSEYVVDWFNNNEIPDVKIYNYARKEVDNYWTRAMKPVQQEGAHIFYVASN